MDMLNRRAGKPATTTRRQNPSTWSSSGKPRNPRSTNHSATLVISGKGNAHRAFASAGMAGAIFSRGIGLSNAASAELQSPRPRSNDIGLVDLTCGLSSKQLARHDTF
jgi:hypothetical protein